MIFLRLRKYLWLLLIVAATFCGQELTFAMSIGDAVPNSNNSAVVLPGELARPLALPSVNGDVVHIAFKDRPTVLVSLGLDSNVDKMIEWQRFYNNHKNDINFYLLAHESIECMQNIMKQQKLDMPILHDDKISFVRKYNNAIPALFITDKDGTIVYNSEMGVDINSLNVFIDKLLKEGKKELPSLKYVPLKQAMSPTAPPLMNNGTAIKQELFSTIDGQDVLVTYNNPTVLLFWATFNLDKTLGNKLTVLQNVYDEMKEQANFYTVNFGDHKTVAEILERHHSTVPALLDKNGVFLRYSRSFPSIVIIDKNGVIRYRPSAALTAETLKNLIESCDVTYVPLAEPQTAEEWFKRGDDLYKNKNYYYTEAINAYSKAIELNPNYYEAYLKRASIYVEKYDERKALEDLNRMIELKPNVLEPYYLRANVLAKLKKYDLAIADYDKTLALKADEFQAKEKVIPVYMNRGDCYLFLKKYDSAIADYNKVLALNPLVHHALDYRGLAFLELKDFERAIADFTQAIELNPTEKYFEDRAIAYLNQQKVDLAIEDFTKIINMNPSYRYAYLNRGLLFAKQQKYTEAVADFILEKKQFPRNGVLLFALAQALELSGEKEQSMENYKDAVEFLSPKATIKLAKAQKRVDGDWESDKDWID